MLKAIFTRLRRQRGETDCSKSLTERLLTAGSPPADGMSKHQLWRVACSCGFEREATSAWAATAIAKLHVQMIRGAREQDHTFTIEEPLRDDSGPTQLPLV